MQGFTSPVDILGSISLQPSRRGVGLCLVPLVLIGETHRNSGVASAITATHFMQEDHQLLLSDFSDCGVRALHCLCLNVTLKTGNSVWI